MQALRSILNSIKHPSLPGWLQALHLPSLTGGVRGWVFHLPSLTGGVRGWVFLWLLPSLTGGVWGWVFASCTSTDDEPVLRGKAIAMAAYTSQPITRADSSLLADMTIPSGKSIGVYAYYHNNSTWAVEDAAELQRTAPNFMRNQKATNQGTALPFSYSPLKYWPNNETDKVSFIAYYPYCNGATDDGTPEDLVHTGITPLMNSGGIGVENGTGLPKFRFAVKDDVKQQVDFMVSRLIPDLPQTRDTEGDPGTPFNDLSINDRVRFYFLHATSKIEFCVTVAPEARKDLAYFTLHGISITNIYNEGRLTPTYSTGVTTLTWSGYEELKKTDYSCKTTEAYLLLPQTLRADAHLIVTYDLAFKSEGTTYTYDGSGNPVATEEYAYINRTTDNLLKDLKISGSEECLTAWLPNHKYVYNIVINPHGIEFTGQVVEWGDTEEIDDIVVEER